MIRLFVHLPIALVLALGITVAAPERIAAQKTLGELGESEERCGEYGTTISFATSPAEAAKKALKDEKLVFVLHVSGNFETPDYT